MQKALCFDDVSILDNYNDLQSRTEVDLSQVFKGHATHLPILAASMDTVTSEQMGATLLNAGAGCVHHRYCSLESRFNTLLNAGTCREYTEEDRQGSVIGLNGIAVGVNDDLRMLSGLIKSGDIDLVSLDVAACYHENVFNFIEKIGPVCKKEGVLLMVGNFSSVDFVESLMLRELITFVDFLKVSQGGGSACSTRQNIGVGKPTWQSVKDLYDYFQGQEKDWGKLYCPKIVADGGLRTPGDIVKALGAGANLVMLGSMLSGYKECPGDVIEFKGEKYKEYKGMASRAAKESQFDEVKNVEGVSTFVPYKGSIVPFLKHVKECLQSGIATAGFKSLSDFIGNAQFIQVSRASQAEAQPHILRGQ